MAAKGFTLSIYPWVYVAQSENSGWKEEFQEKPHKTPAQEAAMGEAELNELLARRNSFADLPLVNYTTQYGMGCFEGLKAFPQKDGSLRLFRPDRNARRFRSSMEGLKMPSYPEETFVKAVRETVRRNRDIGFAPNYDPAWEAGDFAEGHAVYVRPFSYSEPAIGLGLSASPWVVIITTPVGAYFRPGNSKAVTTDKVRAFPGGTGWIKCDANYVVPILAKKEAEAQGYMEAIFLDAEHKEYVEEGSSCNIFFVLKNGTLVTPDLSDTILPGITRTSVIQLAQDLGVNVEERRISIHEVMDSAVEAFVTGTAAGISYFESITHKGQTRVFNDGKIGDTTRELQVDLKGIQYGSREDRHGWMVQV
ncbi:branched-chain-amino-acid transaminase [Marispirochaeta aestuarii]|uniref:branched-chain-amino-acid transaminase n=1 Tax=Marispirochaeta aestuarii TaxID=1963862 RepID=UPI0029C99B52|nr:branched-chain-amino-acid transaminase [Marispirochaeta aestuarii]